MQLSTEIIGQTAVITIVGDLDAATAPEATEYVSSSFESGWMNIIIDLGQVLFMSSAGLRFILDAHQRGKKADVQVSIAAPNAGVEKVLTNSGFTRILSCYASVEEALNETSS
jgi:anti-anti-sigma factor